MVTAHIWIAVYSLQNRPHPVLFPSNAHKRAAINNAMLLDSLAHEGIDIHRPNTSRQTPLYPINTVFQDPRLHMPAIAHLPPFPSYSPHYQTPTLPIAGSVPES